ncbi:hypothetical protein [Streptomyces sp. NPDC051684]|uniref:hypothetical protein n=1 Tax=Streptomyces sp. NPDC051684 TaxID=3365670 RepID=UPI0037B7AE35
MNAAARYSSVSADFSPYRSFSPSSSSGNIPDGGVTVIRTMPRSNALFNSRDTFARDRSSRAAISGCRTPWR